MPNVKCLELFAGRKSFSKEAEKRGFQVFTVDFKKRFKPDAPGDNKC